MLGQKQIQGISQRLALSKNMQQSIGILNMNTIDLKNYLERELIENPFLQTDEDKLEKEEKSFREPYKNNASYNQDEIFSKLIDKTISLKEHLIQQIELTFQGQEEKFIATYITDMIDENGYLRTSKSEISKELKVPIKKVEEVIRILKTLDPIGVYSQDLKECLKLQAIEKSYYDDKFQLVLSNINLVANLDYQALKRICKISDKELKELILKLKKLNPKPGRDFFTSQSEVVLAEVIITGDKDNGFNAIINDNAIPKCWYQNNLEVRNLSKDEKSYCAKNKRTALDVIKALTKRKKLLLNFASTLLDFQYEFFAYGVKYLKPLVIADLAKKLNVNESTISRIGNKYIDTPHGTFEFKYFFSSKLKSELTEDCHSSRSVKNIIQEIISSEDAVLADQDISNLLANEHNIAISRRTVAKYREFMNIPTSAIRKRLKKMGAK